MEPAHSHKVDTVRQAHAKQVWPAYTLFSRAPIPPATSCGPYDSPIYRHSTRPSRLIKYGVTRSPSSVIDRHNAEGADAVSETSCRHPGTARRWAQVPSLPATTLFWAYATHNVATSVQPPKLQIAYHSDGSPYTLRQIHYVPQYSVPYHHSAPDTTDNQPYTTDSRMLRH